MSRAVSEQMNERAFTDMHKLHRIKHPTFVLSVHLSNICLDRALLMQLCVVYNNMYAYMHAIILMHARVSYKEVQFFHYWHMYCNIFIKVL